MGPVKAALESSVRYMAAELEPEAHPRSRALPGAAEDTRRVRHRALR